MPINALAPKVTGVNRLTDWVVQRLDPNWFSTAPRTLIETAQGVKTPITEQNYTPEELDLLRRLIAFTGKKEGDIQYKDYAAFAKQQPNAGDVKWTFLTPLENIKMSLGRFNFKRDANGNVVVYDTYDFNPPSPDSNQEVRTGEYGLVGGPHPLIREYAGEKIPPGYGRNVLINLGR
jgi:hypothetical protein